MTETEVENEICPTCGTELPAIAEFCYHCGNPVKAETASNGETQEISDVWLRGDIAVDSGTEHIKREEISGRNVKTAVRGNDLEKDLENFQKKSGESELKSAASLRVKAKQPQTKKIEIKWEEYDNAPNIRFVGGAVILAIFTLLIFVLAMYLR